MLDKNLIADLIKQANAEIILPAFKSEMHVTKFEKIHGTSMLDLTTEIDSRAELWLTQKIQKHYPEVGIIGEEGHEFGKSRSYEFSNSVLQEHKTFITLDPIDGTNAFANKMSHFCTMLSAGNNHIIEQAWLYSPVIDKLVYAEIGSGVFVNGERFTFDNIKSSIFETDIIYTPFAEKELNFIHNENPKSFVHSLSMSAETLGMLKNDNSSCAHISSIITPPWDFWPIFLVINEAGGYVWRSDDKPANEVSTSHFTSVIASNEAVGTILTEKISRFTALNN